MDQVNKKEGKQNSTDESSSSKELKRKKEKTKCSYYNKGFHLETSCMKKTIDLITQSFEQHHLEDSIPNNATNKPSDKP